MQLASTADILSDLGYDSSLVNITNAAKQALDLATTALAAQLQTDFKMAVVTDVFYVQSPTIVAKWDNFSTTFRLSQGFLTGSPPLQALYADSSTDLASGNTVDISTAMTVDQEKGGVVDILTAYGRQWVKMIYTKGFPVLSDDPNTYDPAYVPDWLAQAAKLHAKISLQSNPSLEDAAVKMDTKLLQDLLSTIVKPHMRYIPNAKIPMTTSFSGVVVPSTAIAPLDTPATVYDDQIVGIGQSEF